MTDIALVGGGYWGQNLLRSLLETNGVGRVYCVEPSKERRETLARRFGQVTYLPNEDSVLQNPRVAGAVIATPASTHGDIAGAWIDAGKHVLVEKPVATDHTAAEDLLSRARRKGVAVVPGHTYLFETAMDFLVDFIGSGEFGTLLSYSGFRMSRGTVRSDVSVLWDLGPHDAAVVSWLFNPSIAVCHAVGTEHQGSGSDSCTVIMRSASHAAFTFNLSWRWPFKVRRAAFVGSRRTVVWDATRPSEPLAIYNTALEGPPDREPCAVPDLRSQTEPLVRECQHFVDVANGVADPIIPPEHILNVTSMLEVAERDLKMTSVTA